MLLYSVFGTADAQQPSIIEKTELTEVKLYQTGAYINRTAKVSLNAGYNELVF